MSLAVECQEEAFKAFKSYLDGEGIRYNYYMRETRGQSTIFHLEVKSMDESVIQVIQDYVKHKGLRVELEINQERYNVLDWDPGELMEKVRDAQRRGSLVRGYHY